ncbi:futalosine hydrolase [Paenibacillus contaminans]|uniref:Futalosine hydrolase n=1 Tax=Paenibacillus contaminans TaxID=450362 RepID=A0A329MM79_9BACL|nr:futalosine hydrolase [Paenibacillus contaminans]RAV19007.1 futalosine hydrolase [Paenibacillus contaminans]
MNVNRRKRVLIAVSVDAERDAVLRGLGEAGSGVFEVFAAGVGTAPAAASTAKKLASGTYDLVVNAGICGGFAGQAEIGSLVVASEIVAADLGAESAEGFIGLDELGFGLARAEVDAGLAGRAAEAFAAAGLPVVLAPILTVSTVTGTAASAAELASRVPGAAGEGMEGFGVAAAAKEFGLPVLEIRAVSNAVGPRDKSAWRIKEALQSLEAASKVLTEVFS